MTKFTKIMGYFALCAGIIAISIVANDVLSPSFTGNTWHAAKCIDKQITDGESTSRYVFVFSVGGKIKDFATDDPEVYVKVNQGNRYTVRLFNGHIAEICEQLRD